MSASVLTQGFSPSGGVMTQGWVLGIVPPPPYVRPTPLVATIALVPVATATLALMPVATGVVALVPVLTATISVAEE